MNYPMKRMLESDEGIDTLFRFTTERIIITSSSGEILRMNPLAERMFGYNEDELIGQKVEIVVPQRFFYGYNENSELYKLDSLARQLKSNLNLYGCRKNGNEFPIEITSIPFVNNNGRLVIALVIDISTRRQTDNELLLHSTIEKEVVRQTKILEKTIRELETTKVELKKSIAKRTKME